MDNNIPEGAQYYLPMKDDPTVACLYYRIHPVQLNDGTTYMSLQYRSFAGLWMISNENPNYETYVKERLIKL